MPSSLLANLNSAFSLSFQRAVSVKHARSSRNLIEALPKFSRLGLQSRSLSRHSNIMAASGTTAASGDCFVADSSLISSCGNVSSFAKPGGVYFGDRSGRNCRKGSVNMRNLGVRNTHAASGGFVFDVRQRSCNSSALFGVWLNGCGDWSIRCYSDGAAPEVSVEGSSSVEFEHLASLAVSAKQETLSDGALKLLPGSCYLPHPDKEKTGGEDAHFICSEEQVIGVADGVGGWADVGINAGDYARELMSNSVNAIRKEPNGIIEPAQILENAHQWTKAKGSSTACIIALTEKGLNAINLGDSGFIVVRDGRTIFESPPQQHSFNFTYQLESGTRGDLPSSGQVFTIPVEAGDVIVAGTDGLFDNLYNNEVSSTVAHAVSTGLSPDATAQKIAALARQRALDRKRQTPFSTAAQEAGFHYYGGKLDDITVVVSYVTS